MSIQITKVWLDDDKMMAEQIAPEDFYQPQQEPVAWRAWFDADNGARWLFSLWPEEERLDVEWQPLYTSPPAQRKPLTNEQIERIYTRYGGDMMNCARAIEHAHGIKGDA